jgi:phage terminase Nu1 subunit (DNA packaging protein)
LLPARVARAESPKKKLGSGHAKSHVGVGRLAQRRFRQTLTLWMMIMLPSADAVATGKQLGEVLGVTSRQIERLAVDGVLKPVRCKARGKHYRLAEAVQAYLQHQRDFLRQQFSGNGNAEYDAARTRRMQALATAEELALAEKQGTLLNAADVDFWVSLTIRNFRDQIRAVPSKVMHALVGLKTAMQANMIVSEAIDLVLNQIADGKIDVGWMMREQKSFLIGEGFSEDQADEMVNETAQRREQRFEQRKAEAEN